MKATTKITTGKTKLAELIADQAMALDAELFKETTATCNAQNGMDNRWLKLADRYYEKGIRVAMLEGKGSGNGSGPKDPRYQLLWDQVHDAIRASFDESIQALFKKEPKTLSQFDREIRSKYLGQKTTTLFGHIRRTLAKIEATGGAPKGRKVVKTGLARVRQNFEKEVASVKKMKPEKLPEGFSVQGFTADVKALIAKWNLPV